jgi:hypothetical protein
VKTCRVKTCLLCAAHVSEQDSRYHMIIQVDFHMPKSSFTCSLLVKPDSCVTSAPSIKVLLAHYSIHCRPELKEAPKAPHCLSLDQPIMPPTPQRGDASEPRRRPKEGACSERHHGSKLRDYMRGDLERDTDSHTTPSNTKRLSETRTKVTKARSSRNDFQQQVSERST